MGKKVTKKTELGRTEVSSSGANSVVDAILSERAGTHGEYAYQAELCRRLKNELHTHVGWKYLNSMQQESLDMIMHKVSRIMCGDPNFEDHWRDCEGYSKLVADRLKPT